MSSDSDDGIPEYRIDQIPASAPPLMSTADELRTGLIKLDQLTLFQALDLGNVSEVSRVLAQGESIDNGHIEQATSLRSLPIFQALFDHGWDVNRSFNKLCSPPLGYEPRCVDSTKLLNSDLSRYLLDDDAIVSWFFEHGADPNAKSTPTFTVLSYAVAACTLDQVRLLLSHGGDVKRGQIIHNLIERRNDLG